MNRYKPESLTLTGAVSLGTGVMIGAGIFALLGQIAQLAGTLFPLIFFIGAIVTAFSAYSYIKFSNAYPSAGGIAMYLEKAYGKGVITGFSALLMAFSMVINESLVARTFGTYTLQLFDIDQGSFLVPILGVGLLIFAFAINISGNVVIEKFSFFMALIKIAGISIFGIVGLWVADFSFTSTSAGTFDNATGGYLAAIALSVLAYKGFTTITNSGSEIVDPHRNVSRAIIISITICAIVYLLVSFAVVGSLTLPEIIEARDFALAEAARPFFGNYGLWFTVALAIIATLSGIIASIFAISVGGIAGAFGMQDASLVVGGGFGAILLGIIGIVGGAIANKNNKYAGYLMLISGIFGFIAVSAFWIISGLMLIIGGALALREK